MTSWDINTSGTHLLGKSLRIIEVTESTNTLLRAEVELGRAEEGAVVVAEHQTIGRGRRDRRWEAPPGKALLFSALLYPKIKPDRTQLVGLMVSLGVLGGIEKFLIHSAIRNPQSAIALKWPNDILANGHKLCGILCETGFDSKGQQFVVAGVGLNVNQTEDEFPLELRRTATSLYIMTGAVLPRDRILKAILSALDGYYERLQSEGERWIAPTWLDSAGILGQRVEVLDRDEKMSGICDGLEADGALRLKLPDGTVRRIYSGEIG